MKNRDTAIEHRIAGYRHKWGRTVLAASALTLLAGCADLRSIFDDNAMVSDDVPRDFTPAQAAQPPAFALGDRFRFDNQDMTWQVVNVAENRIHWQSDTGEQQITTSNPLLPAVEWNSKNRGKGKRLISDVQGTFFPLKAGNAVSFKTTVNTDKPPYAWEFDWNCMIAGEEHVQIPMGSFDTFRVECSRQQPEKWIFYYAPRIGYYVKMEATGLKSGRASSRTLKGYVKNAVAYGDIDLPDNGIMPVPTAEVMVSEAEKPKMAAPKAAPEKMMKKEELPEPAKAMEKEIDGPKMVKPEVALAPQSAPAPSQGFVLHLASYKKQGNSKLGEKNLRKRFPAQLADLGFTTKRVDLGVKGIYYRLFAGPAQDKQSAESLCRAIKSRGQYCAVKKLR